MHKVIKYSIIGLLALALISIIVYCIYSTVVMGWIFNDMSKDFKQGEAFYEVSDTDYNNCKKIFDENKSAFTDVALLIINNADVIEEFGDGWEASVRNDQMEKLLSLYSDEEADDLREFLKKARPATITYEYQLDRVRFNYRHSDGSHTGFCYYIASITDTEAFGTKLDEHWTQY